MEGGPGHLGIWEHRVLTEATKHKGAEGQEKWKCRDVCSVPKATYPLNKKRMQIKRDQL